MVLITMLSSGLWADDSMSSTGVKPAEKSSSEPAPETKPKEKSLLDKLGEELLKEVDDTPGANPNSPGEDTDKMERAVKGMRNAGDKLDEGLTADETQKIQKQVIKDLEDIINHGHSGGTSHEPSFQHAGDSFSFHCAGLDAG